MIISIDTEVMIDMASLALSSFDEVGQCANLANQITAHNDWNCKERDSINESILHTKANVNQLFESIESFSKAMNQAAVRFQDTENEYIRLIQGLDCTIGAAVAITTTASQVSPIMSSAATYMSEKVEIPHGMESYSVGNLADSIQVCEFSDVNFQK